MVTFREHTWELGATVKLVPQERVLAAVEEERTRQVQQVAWGEQRTVELLASWCFRLTTMENHSSLVEQAGMGMVMALDAAARAAAQFRSPRVERLQSSAKSGPEEAVVVEVRIGPETAAAAAAEEEEAQFFLRRQLFVCQAYSLLLAGPEEVGVTVEMVGMVNPVEIAFPREVLVAISVPAVAMVQGLNLLRALTTERPLPALAAEVGLLVL